jgi:OOP family OmpA-OmpF porin
MPAKTDRSTMSPARFLSHARSVPVAAVLAALLGGMFSSAGAFADSSGPASVTPVDNSGTQIRTTVLPAQS